MVGTIGKTKAAERVNVLPLPFVCCYSAARMSFYRKKFSVWLCSALPPPPSLAPRLVLPSRRPPKVAPAKERAAHVADKPPPFASAARGLLLLSAGLLMLVVHGTRSNGVIGYEGDGGGGGGGVNERRRG